MAEALAQEVPLQSIFDKLTKVADDLKEKKNNPPVARYPENIEKLC